MYVVVGVEGRVSEAIDIAPVKGGRQRK